MTRHCCPPLHNRGQTGQCDIQGTHKDPAQLPNAFHEHCVSVLPEPPPGLQKRGNTSDGQTGGRTVRRSCRTARVSPRLKSLSLRSALGSRASGSPPCSVDVTSSDTPIRSGASRQPRGSCKCCRSITPFHCPAVEFSGKAEHCHWQPLTASSCALCSLVTAWARATFSPSRICGTQ